MKRKLSFLLLILSAFGSMGCLSPILTHPESPSRAPSEKTQENAREPNVTADCTLTFKTQGLCASIDWVKYPSESEMGEFTLRFWQIANIGEASDSYFSLASTPFVKLWMPDMGHGSSPVEVAPSLDLNGLVIPGVYNVTHVYFVMRGEWEIQVQIQNKDNVIERTSLSFNY